MNRVLSVQSHVVSGSVGNRAAVFPLQLHGIEVDVVNSVNLASMFVHDGQRLSGEDVRLLFNGLLKSYLNPEEKRHPGDEIRLNPEELDRIATDHTHLLTGFVGEASFLREISRFFQQQKRARATTDKDLLWVCDPVLGDNGRLYVAPELLAAYKTDILPFADILTPNHFELQWLAHKDEGAAISQKFDSITQILSLCSKLHDIGPSVIIVTSAPLVEDPEHLYLVASFNEKWVNKTLHLHKTSQKESVDGQKEFKNPFYIRFPHRNVWMGGTGDLMTAMVVSGLTKYNNDIEMACCSALSYVQNAMEETQRCPVQQQAINVVAARRCFLEDSIQHTACRI